ncbi:STM4504/CBY_0614 family protein [Shewanella algae]|uniref:STM4504/CBY_0614 family protein n=1 Tax=Shewanella algae TaxID=38313 RepID=UPI00300771B9
MIYDLYSTRNKPIYPDIYRYDAPSPKLKIQIAQILMAAIGTEESIARYKTPSEDVYDAIFNILLREYGIVNGGRVKNSSGCKWLESYIISGSNSEQFLDVLELACRMIDTYVRSNWIDFETHDNPSENPDDALAEINERMKRDGFGYEFTNGILVRIDDQYIHSEVVKPALLILQDFDGARGEFLSAHEHYKHGAYEECILDCCKSFESLMKTICHDRGWITNKEMGTLPASKLIIKCVENKLIPDYMQNQFTGFKQLLESGVPSIRNKSAGHGVGKETRDIPQGLVSYALHLTATNLVFLGNCYHALNTMES